MRVSGVWLDSHRMVWADAGEFVLSTLNGVIVQLANGEARGSVYVTPAQWITTPDKIAGFITAIKTRDLTSETHELPDANMPALGSRARTGLVEGVVTAIDPVHRTVTLTPDSGEPVTWPVSTLLPLARVPPRRR